MKSRDLWKSVFLIIGAAGIVLPTSFVNAATPATRSNVAAKTAGASSSKAPKKAALKILDVSLGQNGELTGFVLDDQGKAVVGSRILVHLGKKTIAEMSTDAAGQFRVGGLRGGVYQIVHADGVSVFRVWKNGTAPRSAKAKALIIAGKRLVRGQNEVGALSMIQPATLASGAAAITGITLGVIGISEASEASDEADAANAKLDALLATLN
ncbi:MAG: carboxypeptidase-like regulatory domain-containing protein [Planctomycetales bacterium]|jgi:hypothetical protein